MKKSTKKVISSGLAGLSAFSVVCDSGLTVLANNTSISNLDWINVDGFNSRISLRNDSAESGFWFFDGVDNTIYAKGGTFVDIEVDKDNLNSNIKYIEVVSINSNISPIGKSINSIIKSDENATSLRVDLNDIPNTEHVDIVYTFEDGSIERIPFYAYFSSGGRNVQNHVILSTPPKLENSNIDTSGGTLHNSGAFKGILKYTFDSDSYDTTKPNVWGSLGYHYALSLNGDIISDSSFSVNHDDITGSLELIIDFDSLPKHINGNCDIEFSIYDYVGNVTKFNDAVVLDYSAPIINGSVNADNWVSQGITYFNDNTNIEVEFEVSDDESGVNLISILKDGTEISRLQGVRGSFLIDTPDSSYQVYVEDNIGNSKTYNLSEIVQGITDVVKFNENEPSVSVTEENIVNGWFKGDSKFIVDVSDDVGLKSISYKINGNVSVVNVPDNDKNYQLVIDKSLIQDNAGALNIEVVATDVLDKESSQVGVYQLDVDAPVLENGLLQGNISVIDDVAYSRDPLVIKGNIVDLGSGVKTIEIIKDGIIVDNTIPYVINDDGVYSIKLEDNLGNIKNIDLKEIAGVEFSSVVIDADAPIINATIDGGNILDTWYTQDTKLVLDASDNKSIKTITYSINGVETVLDVKNSVHTLELNLADIVDNKGKANIEYCVEDYAGNRSEFSKVIKFDKDAPIIDNASLNKNFTMVGDTAYISGNVILTADIVDEVSSVDTIEVLRDGVVVGNSLPYTISKSGTYSVRVSDIAGNVVEKSIADLVDNRIKDIVIDTGKPVLKVTVDGEVVTDKWYKDSGTLVLKATDTNLKKVSYSINGVDVVEDVNSSSFEHSIKLEDVVNDRGIIEITFKAEDFLGNIETYTKVIKLDKVDAVIEDASLSEKVAIVNGKAFTNKDIVLDATINDKESGVSKIEILKDGVVVGLSLPYTISDSGSYSIRVSDRVGHVVTKSVNELVNLGSDYIVVDKVAPSVSRVKGFIADKVMGKVNWYSSMPVLEYSISDDNLKSISIKVNNIEVVNTISHNGVYNVPLDTADGSYIVDVEVHDNADNITKDSYSFSVDSSNPSIDVGILEGEYKDRGYGLYFAKEPVVSLRGSDTGIGVDEYILVDKDGNEVDRNTNGEFTLPSGEYFARVVDYFGNESDLVSIGDLCSLPGNRVVIDGVSPNINVMRPNGNIGNWYDSNIVYDVSLSDNVGISSASISINGVEVDSFNANSDIKSVSLKGDTSKVYVEDGLYEIKVVVEDNTGFIEEWTESINIDTTAPSIVDSVVLGRYVDRGDYIVFSEKPSIQLTVKDTGIGVSEITLIDKDGNEVSNKKGFFTLDSNEYSVVVKDRLGNTSNIVELKDICNLPNNKIVIDGEKPELSVNRPDGIYNNWFDGDIDYSISARETTGIAGILVNINGVDIVDYKAENNSIVEKELSVSTKGIDVNEDGSYKVSVKVEDIIGNVSEWNDIVYKDTHSPIIDRFVITGNGYLEGDNTNSSGDYGFYIKGNTDVEIHVSDGKYSSGVDKVHYTLVSADGSEKTGESQVVSGVAKVSIAEGFKGYIKAYAVDKVGNKGNVNSPDGITSTGNTVVNNSKIDISLPSTPKNDNRGNSLYNNNINISSEISNYVSGIRTIKWGIGSEVKGVANIDNKGTINGDTGVISKKDKNLVVEFNKDLFISNNENDISLWVEVEDRVGNISKNSRTFSIDKDAPIINVSYDTNEDSSFYNRTRTATIKITERNFRSSDVVIEGVYGTVGNWVNTEGDTWVCDVVFSEDKDYQWSVAYTDMAGNVGNTYNSEKFTVDKSAPILNVAFDNNSVENGIFFKDTRVATVTVIDKNFDSSLVSLEGNGVLGGWVSNGNTHQANLVFDTNGEYDFSVGVKDKAGNVSSNFSSGKFIIDKTKPVIKITGVQDGVSYKKNTGFKVTLSDDNIDVSRCSVTLTGRSVGEIGLIGGINGNTGEYTFQGIPEDEEYDDLYTLKVVVCDKAGNIEEKVVSYSINRYGSKYNFVHANLLNRIIGKSEDIVLDEISVDRLDMSTSDIVVIKDGIEFAIDSKYKKIEELEGVNSNWVYRYSISKEAFNEDGKYQVQIYSKALDGTKNSSLSQEYTFILDTTNPDIIISGIESGNKYNTVSQNVAVEVRDTSGVESIKVLLNDNEIAVTEEDGIYSFSIPESNDRQNLKVTVVDKAGNTSIEEITDFLISTNTLVSLINNSLVKGLMGSLGLFVLFLIAILFKRRKDTKKEELELAQEHAKLYHDSITGGSSSSVNNSSSEN